MFGDLLNKIKSTFSGGANDEAIKKLTEALDKAIEDGVTPEEIAEVQKLQKELGLSDEVMKDVQIKVMEKLIDKINADGSITEEEIRIFNQLKQSLGVDIKLELDKDFSISKEDVQKGLLDVKNFLVKVKDKTVEASGKVVDSTKEFIHKHTEKKEEKPEETPTEKPAETPTETKVNTPPAENV